MQCPPDTNSATWGKGTARIGQIHTGQVTLEMVDADHRHAPAEREGLRRRDPDEQRADEPGPDVTATPASSGPSTPASASARLDDRRDHLHVRPARQLGHHAAEGRVQVDLAGDDGRAHRQVLVDDRGRRLVARGLDRQQQPRHAAPATVAATSALEIAPSRSTTASSVRTLTSVDGTSLSVPPSTTTRDVRAEAVRHVLCGQGGWRTVGIGARHQEHPGLSQHRAQEPVGGDAHRHLVAAGQPCGPLRVVLEPEGQGERPRPPRPRQCIRVRREGDAEGADLRDRRGQDGQVHPFGPALGREDGAHRHRGPSGRAARP